jgi:MoxR-like ATPase
MPYTSASDLLSIVPKLHALEASVSTVVLGQPRLVRGMLITLLARGHALIEGVPGLGKTLGVQAFVQTFEGVFKRVQFTPDLLPSDVVGAEIYQVHSGQFTIKQGPIFTHCLLADEINRAPAKVQSSLLEAMQERQVTIGETTFLLEEPFVVFATQNPVEQEGTYQLPEAQLDRFLCKIVVEAPSLQTEIDILKNQTTPQSTTIEKVLSRSEIVDIQQ